MATNNHSLVAIRGALSELRRAPLLGKAPAAEVVATLTLTLLEEFDRRIGRLELMLGEHANIADRLVEKQNAVEHELAGMIERMSRAQTRVEG